MLNKKITHAHFQRGRERTCEDPTLVFVSRARAHSLNHQHNDEARTRARQPVARPTHAHDNVFVAADYDDETFGFFFCYTLPPHDDV